MLAEANRFILHSRVLHVRGASLGTAYHGVLDKGSPARPDLQCRTRQPTVNGKDTKMRTLIPLAAVVILTILIVGRNLLRRARASNSEDPGNQSKLAGVLIGLFGP